MGHVLSSSVLYDEDVEPVHKQRPRPMAVPKSRNGRERDTYSTAGPSNLADEDRGPTWELEPEPIPPRRRGKHHTKASPIST